jgi:hypothetical protein
MWDLGAVVAVLAALGVPTLQRMLAEASTTSRYVSCESAVGMRSVQSGVIVFINSSRREVLKHYFEFHSISPSTVLDGQYE